MRYGRLFSRIVGAAGRRAGVLILLTFSTAAGISTAVPGCTPTLPTEQLATGYAALGRNDFSGAMRGADAYLVALPQGPEAAEAYYLRGRAYEMKPAPDAAGSAGNLAAARVAYQNALLHNPEPRLEALIHAGLANVAFFRDDYAGAVSHWNTALPRLEGESRGWAMYRVALSNQRLGKFAAADQGFDELIRTMPGTAPAKRAAEQRGARGFFVQLATFAQADNANTALMDLARAGERPVRTTDRQGRTVVKLGPYPNYPSAIAARQRHMATYPDAMIEP